MPKYSCGSFYNIKQNPSMPVKKDAKLNGAKCLSVSFFQIQGYWAAHAAKNDISFNNLEHFCIFLHWT